MPLVFIVSKVFLMRSSEKLNLLRLRTELYSWSISSLYIGVIISKNMLSNTTTVAESLCFDINADTITFVSMIAKISILFPSSCSSDFLIYFLKCHIGQTVSSCFRSESPECKTSFCGHLVKRLCPDLKRNPPLSHHCLHKDSEGGSIA